MDFAPALSKDFLDIQATTECGLTLKCARGMARTYSQMEAEFRNLKHRIGTSLLGKHFLLVILGTFGWKSIILWEKKSHFTWQNSPSKYLEAFQSIFMHCEIYVLL